MKSLHAIGIAVSLAVLAASTPALAQHRGHHGGARHGGGVVLGLGIGLGIAALPYYAYRRPHYYAPRYYEPYYYPPVAVVSAAPPVYVERQDYSQGQFPATPQVQGANPSQASAGVAQQDWFYCADSKTYYPYVQQCAGPWQRVTPRPPAQ